MYTRFFGLNEKPFSIAPDPRYLFMSERHTEALAHLVYGVRESGGFIQLTGEVGTGKTTLVRSLLQQIPETTDVALILNPQISRNEFLSSICEELGVPLSERAHSIKDLTNALNASLLKNHGEGRRTILIVDEAQNLRVDVLEQVRLLTNLETTKQKLLQIILIGQPELREVLARNDLRQLAQRITGRYHLEPLSREETLTYIDHRLKVAGAVRPIFTPAAKRDLYKLTHGVPRMINVIADRAMLGAFTEETPEVTPQLLRKAAGEVLDRDFSAWSTWRPWLARIATVGTVAGLVFGINWALSSRPTTTATDTATTAAPTVEPAPPLAGEQPIAEQAAGMDGEVAIPDSNAAPQANLGAMLLAQTSVTDTDNAFATLFGLWGLEYDPQTARACKQAQGDGLRCLFQRGSLAQVRNLDRPVILSLRDSKGEQHQVVLSGLDERIAVLTIGAESFTIDIDELGQYWFGDYLLLWRPQVDGAKQFIPGMRHADIKWLRESLAIIQGEPVVPMDSELFDQDLETRVRDYQRERRLTVDGLVGYQTQIAINTDLNLEGSPRLARVN
jgi:general secretion pathway protein A